MPLMNSKLWQGSTWHNYFLTVLSITFWNQPWQSSFKAGMLSMLFVQNNLFNLRGFSYKQILPSCISIIHKTVSIWLIKQQYKMYLLITILSVKYHSMVKFQVIGGNCIQLALRLFFPDIFFLSLNVEKNITR